MPTSTSSSEPLPESVIYVSGAANPTSRIGSYALVILSQGTRHEQVEEAIDTTHNRMELTAAISALESLPEHFRVTIISNSEYLVDAIKKKRIDSWEEDEWERSSGGPVKNADLWIRLLTAVRLHTVRFKWVDVSEDIPENKRCYKLAHKALVKASKQSSKLLIME